VNYERPVLQRIRPPRRRLIVIGDIHGCHEELIELLDRIAPDSDDVVISTGDIVRKGPDPVSCLELWRARGYLAAVGNNEEKILDLAAGTAARRLFAPPVDRAVARRTDLVEFVRSWPLVVDVPELNVSVVHGGLYPGMGVEEESIARVADDVTRLRWIRRCERGWCRAGKSKERQDDVLWSEVWSGPRTVVYGHTPLRDPRVDRFAIGLDTGCVYGGWLIAAIYDGRWRFERVRAKRKYAN